MNRLRAAPTAPPARRLAQDETGAALVLVLLLLAAIAMLAVGAVLMTSNAVAINHSEHSQRQLEPLAIAGIERARARLALDKTLVRSGVTTTIEENSAVSDAHGTAIAGVRRWTYVRQGGNTSGEYLPVYYVLSMVEDAAGRRVLRRAQLTQQSFAQFAYFADEFGGLMVNGDRFSGPVHFNDHITIGSGKGYFNGRLTVSGRINGKQNGVYGRDGYKEYADEIPLPDTRDLDDLEALASKAGYNFTSSSAGNAGEAILRIEFVFVDLNKDGVRDANEGFFKVYEVKNAANTGFVVATQKVGSSKEIIELTSANCGDYAGGSFRAARWHHLPWSLLMPEAHKHEIGPALRKNNAAEHRCFLGGAKELTLTETFFADDGIGVWKKYTGPWLVGKPARLSEPDLNGEGDYLWPLSPTFNPNVKGVIHVRGKVAVSGVLRGRVTLAATYNIIVADDILYATDPGAEIGCGDTRRDMLGLFSGRDIVLANNNLNAPRKVETAGSLYYTNWDDTSDERIDGVLLALGSHYVEDVGTGAGSKGTNPGEPCQGQAFGRGCIFYNGGSIMKSVGAHEGGSGSQQNQGHLNRSAFDVCAAVNPPPYFPTTGQFFLNKMIEEDPTNKTDLKKYLELLDVGG